MKLIVDANSIKVGGGIEHLKQLLNNASLFNVIIVACSKKTSVQIGCDNNRVFFFYTDFLSKIPFAFFFWTFFLFPYFVKKNRASVVFSLGGICFVKSVKYVSILQNLQIFDIEEFKKERQLSVICRLFLLKLLHIISFKHASGLIFLSTYAVDYLKLNYPKLIQSKPYVVVPHGIDKSNLDCVWRFKSNISFKFLYVSTVKMYKNHVNLIRAFDLIKRRGYNVELHLVGDGDFLAKKLMFSAIEDSEYNFTHYHGHINKSDIFQLFRTMDFFIFPSSCESFGISLLEAMQYGFPIACANKSSLPEVLKEAGVYFDPNCPISIANTIEYLINNNNLACNLSAKSHIFSEYYSWDESCTKTYNFIMDIARGNL